MGGSCKIRHFCGGLRWLNPFKWSVRTTKVVTATFFLIALPIYLFIGLQPIPDAEATDYPTIEIPTIRLASPVKPLQVINRELETPDTIAGSYQAEENKILLIGHSSTVFKNLKHLQTSDQISYDQQLYKVVKIETLAKSDISMAKILSTSSTPTIILMTCAGDSLPNQDATHRLIVTAELIQ